MVAATFPIMELLTLLGGVDPDALLGAFLVTLGIAVLGCCLALGFSIGMRRTHEASMATYVVWGLCLLGRPMVNEINNATGVSLGVLPWTFEALHKASNVQFRILRSPPPPAPGSRGRRV